MCNIDTDFKTPVPYRNTVLHENDSDIAKEKLIRFLLLPLESKQKLDAKYIDMLTREVLTTTIPTEAKVSYLKYIQETVKDEIQHLRGQIITSVFNAELAFSISRNYEANMQAWYKSMCRSLEPSLTLFNAADQQKIIAVLTKEKADVSNDRDSIALFERLMKFM